MAVKRVTVNFKEWYSFGDTESDKAKFKELQNKAKADGLMVKYDRRNNIYCINPTMDYEMYLNYCEYLNAHYNEWTNYGYFDMGMVPFLMWPSFMEYSNVIEQMREVARRVGVDLVKVPAVSFLKSGYSSIGIDYWIFREDLKVLCDALAQTNPVYSFNMDKITDISLSEFLKPLAAISASHRV